MNPVRSHSKIQKIYQAVCADINRHCLVKGYEQGPGVNNFVPHDAMAAFAMARQLTFDIRFDHYLVVAPEGHIYGYFFERLGLVTIEVVVPYPPDRLVLVDDLSVCRGKRVLIIEDDIISGRTLGLVVDALRPHSPQELSLFLGHSREVQHLGNVPTGVQHIYLSEDACTLFSHDEMEKAFLKAFTGLG